MNAPRRQKDRALPLKRPITEAIYLRPDSRFWQARFFNADGNLVRRSTRQLSASSARQWMACAKRAAVVVTTPPPRRRRTGQAAAGERLRKS